MVLVQEWIRERFWAVPTVLLVAGVSAGLAVSSVDSIPGLAQLGGGLPIRTASAETLLGIIAASMLTFVGVVFTITLVALQLASAQLSPRVIRTFVRSGITKVAFGLFLATFGYAIVVIVVEGASSNPAVLRLAVTLGVVLVLASLGVFVMYVTATMRLLQVSWVVTAVAEETRRAIGANRPSGTDYVSVATPGTDQDPPLVRLRGEAEDDVRGRFGVILGIDRGRLVQLGKQYDCMLQFLPKVGQYLPPGEPIVAVHGGSAPPDEVIRRCVHLGRARTMYQDPLFGIRQLVDVASQALSPAVNQPTTAVIVIDRVEELLLRIGRRPQPSGLFVDTDNVVRLVHAEPTWTETVDLAFTEIAIYGAGSPAVTRRLSAAYGLLGQSVTVDLRVDIDRHISLLEILAGAAILPDHPMSTPYPDPRGLG
ncbi:MAG TPA: DUF2254 domain-containing protein [Microlunatus sp.]